MELFPYKCFLRGGGGWANLILTLVWYLYCSKSCRQTDNLIDMDWDWALGGITDEIPRTTGPECINYMTDRRRWTETVLLSALFIYIMHSSWQRLAPIRLPPPHEVHKPHSPMRLLLLISMSIIFGIEMGFKLAGRSMIFALNPCHVQTCLQVSHWTLSLSIIIMILICNS